MELARQTWLSEDAFVDGINQRHFFVVSDQDPDLSFVAPWYPRAMVNGDVESLLESDVLVVACPHGYTSLLQKMALAYRLLLAGITTTYFIRADVDSVIPLQLLMPLMKSALRGDAVVRLSFGSRSTCRAPIRWQRQFVGFLVCQSECSVDRGCLYFAVDQAGSCMTFTTCEAFGHGHDGLLHDSGSAVYDTYEYRLRAVSRGTPVEQPLHDGPVPAFILGTILYGNLVLRNDTFNPQWNNPRYREDLGLDVYPPYPEASGYAMTAAVAAFLAAAGSPGSGLQPLAWKAWAIEDAAFGTILAGLNVAMLQMPSEIRDHFRVIEVRPGSRA